MGNGVRVEIARHSWGTLVKLSAPEVRNALNGSTIEALVESIIHGEGPLVLAARGPSFCAGADVGELRGALEADRLPDHIAETTARFHRLLELLLSTPRPTVAAITGTAAGGGMGLALACDLRIAGRSATLVPAYIALGAVPDGGATALLTRVLGPSATKAVLLSGQRIRAESTYGELIFSEVGEDADALPRAIELATALSTSNQRAIAATKRLVDAAWQTGIAEQLERERNEAITNGAEPEFVAGIRRFFERSA